MMPDVPELARPPAPPAAAAGRAAAPRWADLPGEVLGLVLAGVELQDRCRSLCVCRAWREKADALPALWAEASFDFEPNYLRPERASLPRLAMAWCAGRAGAITDLALGFSDYEDFVETDGIDRERYRELAELRADVAAALAACGPRLRSLALDDAYGAVKLGHSPTVQFLLGGCLRGLRELRMPVPEAATWRALAGLTALTALTADSTGAIASGTANYSVGTPLPPALVSLLLEVALEDQFGEEPGPAWRLPAALSELQLTRLALLRGDRQRENSEYVHVHDADWALLASLTTLRRLELAAALTLTSLAGVGALTRLEHLDLRRACAPTDVANEDYHYCPSSLDLEELARLPRLRALCMPRSPFPASLVATTTLRELWHSHRDVPLPPGAYLEGLERLHLGMYWAGLGRRDLVGVDSPTPPPHFLNVRDALSPASYEHWWMHVHDHKFSEYVDYVRVE